MELNKSGVILIHGLNKSCDTWNITEFGKSINIEQQLAKKAHTILIQIDDYNNYHITNILNEMDKYKVKSWIVVCHSLAIVYGLHLLNHGITRVCLIDPTVLDDIYFEELKKREWFNLLDLCEIDIKLSAKVIYHIHLDYDDKFDDKVNFYKKFIKQNDKSKMFVHPDKGHMIHYTDSQKIINSIMDLIKY